MNHETLVFFIPALIGLVLSIIQERVTGDTKRMILIIAALFFFGMAAGVELAYLFDPQPGRWIATFKVVQA